MCYSSSCARSDIKAPEGRVNPGMVSHRGNEIGWPQGGTKETEYYHRQGKSERARPGSEACSRTASVTGQCNLVPPRATVVSTVFPLVFTLIKIPLHIMNPLIFHLAEEFFSSYEAPSSHAFPLLPTLK